MPRDDTRTALPVESELVAEKASALARVTAQVEKALEALAACDRERERGGATPELDARRASLRAVAGERLWFLIVQREALGLRDHEAIFRFYGVTREIRLAMGPRRRGPEAGAS